MPDWAITTDIIVGFPGETEDDFAQTLDYVRSGVFANAFMFMYSIRRGTPAARWEQVPHDAVVERFGRLVDAQNAVTREYHDRKLGTTVRALVSGDSKKDAMKLATKATDNVTIIAPKPPATTNRCTVPSPGSTCGSKPRTCGVAWARSSAGRAFRRGRGTGRTPDGKFAMSVRRSFSTIAVVLAALLASCGGGNAGLPARNGVPQGMRQSASQPLEFVGFWESWSDWNDQDAFNKLGNVPATVTNVNVAFSIANSNQISDPQNTYPLKPGAKKIHKHGGKVLLSFGGATSPFNITDPKQFVKNLRNT